MKKVKKNHHVTGRGGKPRRITKAKYLHWGNKALRREALVGGQEEKRDYNPFEKTTDSLEVTETEKRVSVVALA